MVLYSIAIVVFVLVQVITTVVVCIEVVAHVTCRAVVFGIEVAVVVII